MPARARVVRALHLLAGLRHDPGLTLTVVAEGLSITDSYLSRTVHREMHTDFSSLVHAFRIVDAAVLLRTSCLSIKEIAASVGYKGTEGIDRAFSRYLRMTPGEFRTARFGHFRNPDRLLVEVRVFLSERPNASPAEIADALRIDFGVAAGFTSIQEGA